MSILVLAPAVYTRVAHALTGASANRQMSDVEHPLCIGSIFRTCGIQSIQQICRFTALLEAYNEASDIARKEILLKAPDAEILEQRTQHFMSYYNDIHNKQVSIYQLYKWLQCITYNIDLEGYGARYEDAKEQDRYEFTVKVANQLKHAIAAHIISFLPEYDQARWASI